MRFLLDQDVYAMTARFLAGLGHDVGAVARSATVENKKLMKHLASRRSGSKRIPLGDLRPLTPKPLDA